MTVKRFKKILNDNSEAPKRGENGYDKLYKFRPLIDKLNQEFHRQCVATSSQSIDEAMILFKGRSSLKQYMPMKPNKRGYKAWMGTCWFVSRICVPIWNVYVGKQNDDQVKVGLGGRVVKRLRQQLEFKAVHVAFDNFFSSPSLMKDLTAKKIYSTGTVSANRRAATSCKTEVKKGAWRNELKKPRQLRVCTVYGHKTCSCSVVCICCYWNRYGKSTTERWIHQSDKLSSAGYRVHCTHGWSGSLWSEDRLLQCKQAI